jgi:hypothetical protein
MTPQSPQSFNTLLETDRPPEESHVTVDQVSDAARDLGVTLDAAAGNRHIRGQIIDALQLPITSANDAMVLDAISKLRVRAY